MDKSQKTIAIVINTSWNVYNFRLNLLKSLQKEGYKIVVIAPKDTYSKLLEDEGFEFHHLELDNDSTNTLKELKLFFHLLSIYRDVKPDILLHYTIKPNIYGTLAAVCLKIPTICNVSGLGTVFLNEKLSSKIARSLYRLSFIFPKKVFFQNCEDKKMFIEKKLIKEKIADRINGSGINPDKYIPKTTASDAFIFLLIARLIKDKGILEYIDAIKIIKEKGIQQPIRFKIIGGLYEANPTAVKEHELKRWIDEGLIKYIDHTDYICTHIAKASCVVLPSYREGLSRSLLEAASMAKPIVTTDVPGCKDIIDDGVNGYLCKVKDSNSLADAMLKMLELSDSQREEMGKKGREKVMHEFSDDVIITKYSSIIQQTLNI